MILYLSSCTSKKSDPTPGLSISSFSPVSGAAGANITIKGASFSDNASNNTVTFNGVPGTVTGATTTQITVLVPTGAASGKITVTVNSKSTTSTEDFIILQ